MSACASSRVPSGPVTLLRHRHTFISESLCFIAKMDFDLFDLLQINSERPDMTIVIKRPDMTVKHKTASRDFRFCVTNICKII